MHAHVRLHADFDRCATDPSAAAPARSLSASAETSTISRCSVCREMRDSTSSASISSDICLTLPWMRVQPPLLLLGRIRQRQLEQPGLAGDRRERRAQIVRDGRGERFELAIGARQRFVRIAQLPLAGQREDVRQRAPQQDRRRHGCGRGDQLEQAFEPVLRVPDVPRRPSRA